MSLQVWLPMTNTFENHGLLGPLTQTAAPAYVNGKLGKALSTGGCKMSASQTASVLNNKAISICFWVYINADTGTTDNKVNFFGSNGMGENNNRKFSLFNYPTVNDFHWSWMNDAASAIFAGGVIYGALPSYQWTHVAITYENPNGTIYMNGVKKHTFTGVSNSSSFAYETQVIYNSSYMYRNDFRIYDHCLSPKEVKEISKGLFLHYPLSNSYNTTVSVNKYSGTYAEGKASSYNNFTCTPLEDEPGYNYKFTYTGNGNNTWNYIRFPTVTFTAGKFYDYSCKVRYHSLSGGLDFCFRAARISNDWVTSMISVVSHPGIWMEYHLRLTLNAKSERSGTTYDTAPCIEFYTSSMSGNGTAYALDLDIKDIQITESPDNNRIPFSNGSYQDSMHYDSSGYLSTAIPIESIGYSSDSPRYDGCYSFSDTSHFKVSQPLVSPAEFSCSFWVKLIDIGTYAIITSNYNNPGSGFWIAVNCEGSGLWFYNGGYARSHKGLLSTNTWYHCCLTFKNGVFTWYQNGENAGSTDLSSRSTTLGINDTISIGNSYTGTKWNTKFNGSISDFRMYATALSASDVKELYNTPISITNTGVLMTHGEFKEV